jgi:hypothetical protein
MQVPSVEKFSEDERGISSRFAMAFPPAKRVVLCFC